MPLRRKAAAATFDGVSESMWKQWRGKIKLRLFRYDKNPSPTPPAILLHVNHLLLERINNFFLLPCRRRHFELFPPAAHCQLCNAKLQRESCTHFSCLQHVNGVRFSSCALAGNNSRGEHKNDKIFQSVCHIAGLNYVLYVCNFFSSALMENICSKTRRKDFGRSLLM